MLSEQARQVLFLDLETVSQYNTYEELPEALKKFWKKQAVQSYSDPGTIGTMKAEKDWNDGVYSNWYKRKAALHPEFAKIAVAAVGYFSLEGTTPDKPNFRVKSIGGDEKEILNTLLKIFGKFNYFAAHNGKKFDFPFLSKRLIINGISLPEQLARLQSAKPWEIGHLDTQDLWRFGDSSYPSLELLATILNVENNWAIDGSQIHDLFYSKKPEDLETIKKYCAEDVVVDARIYLRIQEPSVEIGKVIYV